MTVFLFTIDPKKMLGIDLGSVHNLARWRDFVNTHEGKAGRIDFTPPTRSGSQNRYYWVYLGIIEKETGNNANDLHEYFKRVLLPPVFKKLTIQGKDVEIRTPASTTDLNKSDFGDYLDKISAMTGVPLPNPEDAGYTLN